LRVGLFTDAYLPEISGVTMAVRWYREELERRGHEVYVYAPRYERSNDDDDRTYRFRAGPVFGYKTARMAVPYSRAAFQSFASLDVVHSHTPFSLAYAAIAAATRHRLPHVQTYHTYLSQYRHYVPRPIRPTVRAAEAYSALLCNRCTVVTVPTAAIKNELIRYGVNRPIHVIPLGPHLPLFDRPACWTPREELDVPREARLFLYAGRLAAEKNLLFLLRGFARIRRELPDSILVVAGDGPLRERMEREANALGIRPEVRFTGFLDHPRLVDLYRAADLFLFASKTETQGLVLVEAMAGGTPAVAVGELGVVDVVRDGVNGYLVSEDETRFARAAVAALSDQETYASLCSGAKSTAVRMSVQSYADLTIELYKACLLSAVRPARRFKRFHRIRRRRRRAVR
jgi:1,2-diacylglycerol 3-alpha-glucosyltransferase